jgi:hypothetical protein
MRLDLKVTTYSSRYGKGEAPALKAHTRRAKLAAEGREAHASKEC